MYPASFDFPSLIFAPLGHDIVVHRIRGVLISLESHRVCRFLLLDYTFDSYSQASSHVTHRTVHVFFTTLTHVFSVTVSIWCFALYRAMTHDIQRSPRILCQLNSYVIYIYITWANESIKSIEESNDYARMKITREKGGRPAAQQIDDESHEYHFKHFVSSASSLSLEAYVSIIKSDIYTRQWRQIFLNNI